MNRLVRMVILMVGMLGAYTALAAPVLPAPDGGPLPLCDPAKKCTKGPGQQ